MNTRVCDGTDFLILTPPYSTQDLVEKVVVLRRAVEQTQRSAAAVSVGSLLAEELGRYAGLLASQGSLSTAISYLPNGSEQVG